MPVILVVIVVMLLVSLLVTLLAMLVVMLAGLVVATGFVVHDDGAAVAYVAACRKRGDRREEQYEAEGSLHASPISIEGREHTGA